jgi:arsenite-transporting ATPase
MRARCIFHIGKGGVGKSTVSALTALAAAAEGRHVLLLSLDPAHNQGDLFGEQFGDKAKTVCNGLAVIEADIEQWIARYLDDVQERMRAAYTYLTALNLEHHFRVLRHSPGLEEFALRRVFEHMRDTHRDVDLIVVDMPPTALATRFFASPTLSLAWTEELRTLRRTIKDRREMITRIKLGKKTVEQDRVLNTLDENQEKSEQLRRFFSDGAVSALRIVVNPDTLSWKEALRFRSALSALSIPLQKVIVNKSDGSAAELPSDFADLPLMRIPEIHPTPLGLSALQAAVPLLPRKLWQF